MPRVQILSAVRNGDTVHHANTFVDMSDEEVKAMPPGTVRVMANETEEKSRRASMMNPASSVEDRLVGRVFTGLPGGGGDPPWAQPSDSPIDVYDPETGRPFPDDHEGAREAREASIIERQAKADLRAPGVLGIEPESTGGGKKGEKGDKKADKAAKEQQDAAREAFEQRAKMAAPPPANVQAGPGIGGFGAIVVTTTPTPQGPKPPEKGQTSAEPKKNA